MHLADLDTPALLIDLDVMERNLTRMADYTRRHGLRLRPHTKTHKIPALGLRQLALGAAGLTVAKVGEAEVMTSTGTPDLLVAYPLFGERKLQRLMEVAHVTNVTVSLDSIEIAWPLSAAATDAGVTIGVLLEIDAGLHRVGVLVGPELTALAKQVAALPGLRIDGLAFYPGHIKELDEVGRGRLHELGTFIAEARQALAEAGVETRIVSGGSTPTMWHSHEIAGLTEIRPGTYIFNDRNTVLSGACGWDDCAASILTTIVSTAQPGQVILDGGSKTFSSDRPTAGNEVSFGRICEAPEALFHKMNEEHGFVDVRQVDRTFRVGDRVRVIPNHVCVAMNLHEHVYGIRGEEVEEVWRVEARGKLQ